MKALALQVTASFLGTLLALWAGYAYFMSPLPIPTLGWLWR